MSSRWLTGLLGTALICAGGAVAGVSEEPSRKVAVTIDDLPANLFGGDIEDWQQMTATLLDGLVRHQVPAVGFVNGSKLHVDGSAEPDPARVALLQAWVDAGLELGNHSYSHPDLHNTPLEQYQRDVLRGALVTSRILAAAGRTPRYFRHPFLHTGVDLPTRDAFHAFLADHGYQVAPVTTTIKSGSQPVPTITH